MIRSVLLMFAVLALIPAAAGCRGGLFNPSATALDDAEELARDGRIDEAIETYQAHIAHRLSVRDRPDWENPYLYLLTIGDLEMRRHRVDEAIRYYTEARAREVELSLIADRFRSIARYYEAGGEPDRAIEILTTYRDLDPLLFDGMADRISKQIVREEEDPEGPASSSAEATALPGGVSGFDGRRSLP